MMNYRELITMIVIMGTIIFCVERAYMYLTKKQETIVMLEKIRLDVIKEEKEIAEIEKDMFK
jgi:hypothetical protein